MAPEAAEPERGEEDQRGRNLLAAIMHLAVEDCAARRPDDAVRAYLWLTAGPACKAYCKLLDIEHWQMATQIVRRYGERCEAILRRRRPA